MIFALPFIRVSSSCSVGMKGIFVIFVYDGGFHCIFRKSVRLS